MVTPHGYLLYPAMEISYTLRYALRDALDSLQPSDTTFNSSSVTDVTTGGLGSEIKRR